MEPLKNLLVSELQDLLHAETQLVKALPTMARTAHNPQLQQAFEKHLTQTQQHVDRLKTSFELLDEEPEAKTCKGITGIVEETHERMEELKKEDDLAADLGLIAAAQKAEHYEISAYGTAHYLARQLGERDVAKILSQTLGEEEAADYLLTEIAKPLIQQASSSDGGAAVKGRKAKAQRA